VKTFVISALLAIALPCSLAAASMLQGVSAAPLAGGSTAVAACDSDGFSITYATSGGNVSTVTVGGIASACNGGALEVTVVDGARARLASGGPVTISGTSAIVSVSPNPAGAAPAGVDVSIVGP
jgi:hypothetical protein